MTFLENADNFHFSKIINSYGSSTESKIIQNNNFARAGLNQEDSSFIYDKFNAKGFYSILDECLQAGWDGYDSNPLNDNAVQELVTFLNLLPSTLNDYEIVPEPTGDIGLEWVSKTNHIIISFSGQNKIIFACIFDKVNKIHGEEQFDDIIPESIIALLLRFYKN